MKMNDPASGRQGQELGRLCKPLPPAPHPATHCPAPTVMFPESTRRKDQEGYVRTCRGLKSLDLIVLIFLLPVPAALAPPAPPSTPRHHHITLAQKIALPQNQLMEVQESSLGE